MPELRKGTRQRGVVVGTLNRGELLLGAGEITGEIGRGLLVLLSIPALLLELVLNRIKARDRGHENPYSEPTHLTR